MPVPAKPRLLIIAFTDPKRDPRVYRQLGVLVDRWDIVLCTCGSLDMPGVRCIELVGGNEPFAPLIGHFITAFRAYERAYWHRSLVRQALGLLKSLDPDVILANDIETLPLALKVARSRTRVVLDAHEYEPRHWDDQWLFDTVYRPYWDYICRTYLPHVDGMVSVSPRLAEEYSRNYNVNCGVIMNTPDYQVLSPSETHESEVRVIHHGGINPSRKIENMMHVVGALGPRFSLDLMLINNHKRYMKYLRREASKYNNIRFVDPVPMPDIARTINKYDMGIFMLHPGAFNYRYSLPNKLFEYIQARLAIAIWPSPEMSKIVTGDGLGVVSSEYTNSSMSSCLGQVTAADIRQFKTNSDRAARKYSSEVESVRYRDLVESGSTD